MELGELIEYQCSTLGVGTRLVYDGREALLELKTKRFRLLITDLLLLVFLLPLSLKAQNDQTNPGFFRYFGARHFYNTYHQPYGQHWHLTSLEIKGEDDLLALLGRINYGQRLINPQHPFQSVNMQYQVDAYPIINESNYFYLSCAYSASLLFPTHQTRTVYCHIFDQSIEASLGIYLMQWQTSFPIFTGSVGKYLKNYWISLRPYLVFRDERISQSYTLFLRRYLKTPDDFFTLILGYGSSPVAPAYLIDFNKTYDVKGLNFQVKYQEALEKWIFRLGGGFRYEEFRQDDWRTRYYLELGLFYRL